MVTIHHLEVHLDVEGNDDDAVFRQLFERYMKQYRRIEAEAEERRMRGEQERRIRRVPGAGGAGSGGGAW